MEKESYVADDPFVKSLKKETIVLINQELLKRKRATFAFKRIVDLVGGAIGLVVATPIMLGVAIAMKKEESNGPIIFSQTRVGKNGKTFRMYKIRSMCLDAENKLEELLAKNEVQGAMFKMKDDPRVTKVGKFIRKTSIDELPQLWNVVKGEMSLVGPRPPLLIIILIGSISAVSQQQYFIINDYIRDFYYFLTPISLILLGLNLQFIYRIDLKKISNIIINFTLISLTLDIPNILMNIIQAPAFGYTVIREGVKTGTELIVLASVLAYKLNIPKKKKMYLILFLILSFSRLAYLELILIVIYTSILFFIKRGTKIKKNNIYLIIPTLIGSIVFIISSIVFIRLYGSLFSSFYSKLLNSVNEISTNSSWSEINIIHNWRGYEKYSASKLFDNAGIFLKIFGFGFGKRVPILYSYLVGVDESLHGIPILHDGYSNIVIKSGIVGLTFYLYYWIKNLSLVFFTKKNDFRIYMIGVISVIVSISTYLTTGIFKPEFPQIVAIYFGILSAKKYKCDSL